MSATLQLATTQIRRSPRRVLAILIAALLSAMAITATGTFITALNQSLQTELAAPSSRADAVVTSPTDGVLAEVLANRDVDVAETLYSAFGIVQIENREIYPELQGIPEAESLRWMTLIDGRWPAPGQLAMTQETLDSLDLAVGDSLTASITGFGTEPSDRKFTISGVVELPHGAQGSMTVFYVSAGEAAEIGEATDLMVQTTTDADVGALVSSLNDRFADTEGAPKAYTAQDYVAMLVDGLAGGTNLLATLFMIFVAVALLAASMVIRNTFQVLLAQRLRENGLLRLIGATGTQVQRTVLAEALLLGVMGSMAGVIVGVGLGWGIGLIAGLATSEVPLAWVWMLAAFIATIALTVISAWAPARSTSRLSPMAALTASATTEQTTAKRRIGSWIMGSLFTIIGIAGAAVSAIIPNFLLLVPSGIILAIGLIILVPLFVMVIMPVLARMTTRAGAVAHLAGENLVRTSRRTGTVVLAIALGGSLIIAMLTALQSASTSMQTMLTDDYPVDLVLSTSDGEEIPAEVLSALEESSSTSSIELVHSLEVETTSSPISVNILTAIPNVWNDSAVENVADGELLVPTWMVPDDSQINGMPIEVATTNGSITSLTIRASPLADSIQNQMGLAIFGVVSENTLTELDRAPTPTQAWIIAADGESDKLMDEVMELLETHTALHAYGALSVVQMYEQIFAMVAGFVIGMLGLTIVISAIGLASVVALAVAERGREIALLRALGLTRSKTRRMILIESVSLAGVGAAISLIIGIPLGVTATISALGATTVVISLPWLGIGAVILIAAFLGVIAGLGPAQRATRIAPALGLATD